MTRPFRPGDRVVTVHPMEYYNNRHGVVVGVHGSSYDLHIEDPSPEIESYVRRNGGAISYSDNYLRHADPLSPFDQSVQDYIAKELQP